MERSLSSAGWRQCIMVYHHSEFGCSRYKVYRREENDFYFCHMTKLWWHHHHHQWRLSGVFKHFAPGSSVSIVNFEHNCRLGRQFLGEYLLKILSLLSIYWNLILFYPQNNWRYKRDSLGQDQKSIIWQSIDNQVGSLRFLTNPVKLHQQNYSRVVLCAMSVVI